MSTRKSQKTEQVETAEMTTKMPKNVLGTSVLYDETIPESNVIDLLDPKQVVEAASKMTKDDSFDYEVDKIMAKISMLNNDQITQVIDLSQGIIDSRQKDEMNELDRQIAELQAKKAALRGTPAKTTNGGNRSYTIRPIVNPDDPSQVYTTGKHPQWLKDLVEQEMTMNSTKTSKAILDELRGN